MLLVLARRVHTLVPGASGPAEALLLRRGRVIDAGTRERLRAEAPAAAVLDLGDAVLTPGLTDSHIHVIEWALSRREVDLSGAHTPEEAARMVVGEGDAGPDSAGSGGAGSAGSGWLRGRGWNPHQWGGAYPHAAVLDAVEAERPVALQSHDMHALWVNSAALREAGITRDTPDPAGGRILRDGAGEPTGVLLETAAQLVAGRIPAPTLEDARDAVLDGQAALHRLGITGVHSYPNIHLHEPDPLRLLESLRGEDQLRLRVLQHVPVERLDDALRLGLRSGFGGDWIRIGGVKMFLDGALGSRTALLEAPYEGAGDYRGVEVMGAGVFRDAVARAARAGLATTVHAIGDAAVSLALDVLADPAVRMDTLPHRIEHVQLCPPPRFAEAARAGIVCSMQPAHLITDWAAAERHWGAERCRGAYAFGSLLRSGATLAFGSDAPVEPVDPRLAFFAATARQDVEGRPQGGWYPEERIGMEDVLRGYTHGPAVAAGVAARRGHLGVGADADFVAWDRDPLETEGEALLELRCTAAVVAGEVVWREGAAS